MAPAVGQHPIATISSEPGDAALWHRHFWALPGSRGHWVLQAGSGPCAEIIGAKPDGRQRARARPNTRRLPHGMMP